MIYNTKMLSKKNLRKAGKKASRFVYKASGMVNPIKKGKVSTARLIKDVAILKGIINSEKFKIESLVFNDQAIGQVNGNASGHQIFDITPAPTQGDGYSNRQGNSIKWVSSHFSFFFQKQNNNNWPCTVKIQIIKIEGEPYQTPSNGILGKFIEPNRWVNTGTVYDTSSDRKPEYFKNYKVLRTKTIRFGASQYAGQTVNVQKIINFGLKLPSHHVKWNGNSTTLSQGQVLMLVTMDTGNCSTSTVSTLDSIANTAINTGLIMNCNKADYYYDN